MTKANNREAQIKRVYNPGGTLAADTIRVRSWNATDFSHVYGLKYRYDLNGRRKELVHPEFMAPRVEGVVRDVTRFTYSPDHGQLATVTDPMNNVFSYSYDAAGRLENLAARADIYQRFFYDDDDQLTKRVLRKPGFQGPNAQGFPVDTIQSTRFAYDARGKMIRAAAYSDSVDNVYNGLGALALSRAGFSHDEGPSAGRDRLSKPGPHRSMSMRRAACLRVHARHPAQASRLSISGTPALCCLARAARC